MRNNHSLQILLSVTLTLLIAAVRTNAAILEISPTNQTIISGTTAQFSAQITGAATLPISFSWVGPQNFVSTSQIINVTNAGRYSVTASDAGGQVFGAVCAALNVKLVPTVTVANATLTCSQPKVTLKAKSSAFNGTYAWTGPGIISGNGTSAITVNLPGAYGVTVTALNGCSASASAIVTEDKTPPPLTLSTPDILSSTNPTVLLAASSSSNVFFLWTGPGIVSGSRSNHCTVNLPGSYTVTAFTLQQFGLISSGSISNNGTNIFSSFNPTNGSYFPNGTNLYDTNVYGNVDPTNLYPVDPCPGVPLGAIIDLNNVTNFVGSYLSGSVYGGVIIHTNGLFEFTYDESLTVSNYYANGCSTIGTVIVNADGSFVLPRLISKITGVPDLNGASNSRCFVVAWPTNLSGYILQSASNLSSWIDASNAPTAVDGQLILTNTSSGNVQFYRLKKTTP